MVGFGQAETADALAGSQPGQVFLALILAAIGVDRMHDQRRLDAHRRAITGIDPLDLARDQAVGHVGGPCPAIFLRNRDAEEAEFAHLGHDVAVEALLAEGGQHTRHELALRVVARRVAHHALLLVERALEGQRIGPVEHRAGSGRHELSSARSCRGRARSTVARIAARRRYRRRPGCRSADRDRG